MRQGIKIGVFQLMFCLFICGSPRCAYASVNVTHVSMSNWAAMLRSGTIDAMIDVRTPEEFVASWGAVGVCDGGSDPMSCYYGHVPGIYWIPNLHLMSDADFTGNLTGIRGDSGVGLGTCAGLQLAFICHSGTRSLAAANRLKDLYNSNAINLNANTIHGGGIINSDGGHQEYFRAGLNTRYGSARPAWEGCVKFAQFSSTWNETPPY